MQPPSVQVCRVNWLLNEQDEYDICVHGVAELPDENVVTDASQLYNFVSGIQVCLNIRIAPLPLANRSRTRTTTPIGRDVPAPLLYAAVL
jgi:hypothetical protein